MSEHLPTLHWVDWAVIWTYFLAMIGMGAWIAWRHRTSDDYYLGGRTIPGWAAGLSLFAASISTVTFLAYPAAGYSGDWTRMVPGLMLPLAAIYITIVVIPLYRRVVRLSVYEFLERRFSYPARLYAASVYMLITLFRMGFILFLMAKAIGTVTGWEVQHTILVCGVTTIAYSMLGGARAVIWTDVVQSMLLLSAGLLCVALLLNQPGDRSADMLAVAIEGGKFHMLDFSADLRHPGVLVLLLFGLFQYADNYTTYQANCQRYLAVSSTRQAQKSVWLAAVFCVSTWALFLLIGTLLYSYYALHPGELPPEIASHPAGIFPHFLITHLPVGLVGLFLAAMCAAAMSTLDTAMNSLSLTTIHDLLARLRTRVTPRAELIIAKGASAFYGIIGTCAALSMMQIQEVLDFSFKGFSILAGGMFGMVLLGFFARRAHTVGVYAGLVAGSAVSLWAASTELQAVLPWLSALPEWARFPFHGFLTMACSNVVCFGVGYGASMLLEDRQPRDLTGLTFWTRPQA
jgi:solute:Na+ symporter, SSS family